jgi:eight-cysteine-cluster-containing protein
MVLLALLIACGGAASPPPSTQVPVVSASPSEIAPPAVSDPSGGAPITGADLYGQCRDRVEGAATAGECVTDADCSKAGCSQEVCVSASAAKSVKTSCERLLCFSALDSCGCHEGTCSWTVKEPEMQLRTLPVPGGVRP